MRFWRRFTPGTLTVTADGRVLAWSAELGRWTDTGATVAATGRYEPIEVKWRFRR